MSLLLLWSAGALPAAAGTERYGGVSVSVGDANAEASWSGYTSHPVTIRNDGGATRRVTLRLPASSYGSGSDQLDALTRTFEIAAGGTVNAELLVPPLEVNGSPNAAVTINGTRQPARVPVGFGSRYGVGPPSLLVSRAVGREERSRLDAAMTAYNGGPSSASSVSLPTVSVHGSGATHTSSGYGHGGSDEIQLRTGEPVEQWSRSWLGYSSFAAVLVAEADLARMPAAVASALRGYVLAGGVLTIVADGAGRPLPPGWPGPLPGALADEEGPVGLGMVSWWAPGAEERTDDAAAQAWIRDALHFSRATASPLDAMNAEATFPVVEGLTTPVRGLVLLMLLFSILIGPVNILLLAWFKRRMWLLWTVPLGSAVFSLGVIAYAFLSEGISPKARTQAITLLDQTTREAVTIAMRGYYAPLTPGDGLRFPMSTKVVPQVERQGWSDGGRGRSVDQTSGQHLTRGWVAARVPAHLELTDVSTSRLRLDVEELPGGTMAVTNGLGTDIVDLVVVDSDGRLHRSNPMDVPDASFVLPAGERAELHAADAGETTGAVPVIDKLRRETWRVQQLPAEADVDLQPGMYSARLRTNPFLADGLDDLAEHRVDAAIVGRYAPRNGGTR